MCSEIVYRDVRKWLIRFLNFKQSGIGYQNYLFHFIKNILMKSMANTNVIILVEIKSHFGLSFQTIV